MRAAIVGYLLRLDGRSNQEEAMRARYDIRCLRATVVKWSMFAAGEGYELKVSVEHVEGCSCKDARKPECDCKDKNKGK